MSQPAPASREEGSGSEDEPVRVLTRGLAARATARLLVGLLAGASSWPMWGLVAGVALALAAVVERALLLRALRRGLPAWRCGLEVGLTIFALIALADLNARWAFTSGDLDTKARALEPGLQWRPLARLLATSWVLAAPISGLAVAAHQSATRSPGGGLLRALAPPMRMGPWTVVWPLVWVIAPLLLTVVGVLPGSFAGISTNQGVGDQLLTSVFVAGTWWTACLSAQLLIYIPDRVAWLVAPDAEAPSEPVAESDSSDEPAA